MSISVKSIVILLILAIVFSACSAKPGASNIVNGSTTKSLSLSGEVSPLKGSIASADHSLISSAYAAACGGPVYAKLYELEADGSVDPDSPVATMRLRSDARYTFDIKSLGLDTSNPKVKYVVSADGCNEEFYKRPVTDFNDSQNVNAQTTVVAEVTNAVGLTTNKLSDATRTEVAALISSISGTTHEDALTSLTTDATPSAKFSQIFGSSPMVINSAKPEVKITTPSGAIDEHVSSSFRIQAFHVNPNYDFVYKWKLDGVQKSSSANWNFIPDGHSQGTHTIEVYVGLNDGAGNIDTSMPFFTKSFSQIINNTVRPIAPDVAIAAGTPSPRITTSIDLSLNTGVGLANCESFDHLAITETNTAPLPGAFTRNCSVAGSQTESVSFSSGDGAKSLYVWAMDDAGDISTSKSVSFVLDTTPPLASVSVGGATVLKGGSTKAVTVSFSDVTSSVVSAELSYSADGGSTWSQLSLLSSGTTSYSWSVPLVDVASAKLRLLVTDGAGLVSTAMASFSIDASPPTAPAFAISTPKPTSSSVVSFTIPDCGDSTSVYLSELNIAPNGSEGTWETCVTTAAAYSRTITGDGVHDFYLWSKDSSGFVSLASSHDSVRLDTTVPVISSGPVIASYIKGSASTSITWTATDATVIKASLSYSTDSGATWTAIATDVANSGSYAWTPPALDSAVSVKLSVKDELGFTTATTAATTIDSTSPVAALTQPTGPYKGGASITLNVTATDTNPIASMKTAYSTDGTNFGADTTLSANATQATIILGSTDTTTAKVRLQVTDSAGNVGTFISNVFTVDATPPSVPVVTLTSALINTTNATTMTVASCTDTPFLLVNESTAPTAGDSNWVACSTAASALTYSIPGTTEGAHTLKVWAKDAVGNVSTTARSVTSNLDLSPPVIVLAPPVSVKGGGAGTLTVTLTEIHASSSQSIALEIFDGTSWSSAGSKGIGNGPLTAVPYSYGFTAPVVSVSTAKFRATYADLAGRSTTVTSSNFVIDNTGPAGSTISVNSGATSTNNKNVLVSFSAIDALTKITGFCLRYNQSTAPADTDACWTTLSSIGVTPSKTISVSNYPFVLGSIQGDYAVTAFYMDEHGNIGTTASSYTIGFSPDPAPTLSNLIASSGDSYSSPLTTGDTTVTIGNDLYIRWSITDNAAIPAGNITLSYTTNDTTFTTITSSLSNAANSGCTLTAGATGCYRWSAASPTSGYYRIKLSVTDSGGSSIFDVSNPINTGNVRFLSGNTSLGIGGTATNSILLGANESGYNDAHDTQSVVVTKTGYVFYRFYNRGIVYISPQDGILRDLTLTTGTASGDNGSAFSATLRNPLRMAIDYSDNILIWDYDRVRKIDLSTTPWKITTLFGGGASTTDGAAALSANIGTNYADQITVTPNGRVYFNKTNNEVWYYDPDDSLVKKYITLTGTGTDDMASFRATFDNVACPGANAAFTFDKTNSTITKIMRRMSSTTATACGSQAGTYPYYNTNFDVSTGVATAPHPPQTQWSSHKFTGLDGNIYTLLQGRATLTKYNPVTNTFVNVVGVTGVNGRCVDGTPATSCKAVIMAAFVTEFGKIYFIDLGVLRTVDSAGNVQTVAGQPRNFGIGFNPMSARYSDVYFFEVNGNDVYVRNELENQLVKFSLTGGNLSLVAGDTTKGTPTMGADAKTTPLSNCGWSMPCGFIIDSSTNRLYHYANTGGRVAYIDLATNKWVTQATGFQDASARLSYLGKNSDGLFTFASSHYGVTGNMQTLRVFNQSNNTSTIVYGKDQVLTTLSSTVCTGTTGTSCTYPYTLTTTIQERFHTDTTNNNWIFSIKGQSSLYTVPSLGGTVTLFRTMSNGVNAFDFYHNGTTGFVYYCSTSGNLYKRNLTTNVETALTLPISSMKCSSSALFYNSSRNSLIFAYAQNGLTGIAEYLSP